MIYKYYVYINKDGCTLYTSCSIRIIYNPIVILYMFAFTITYICRCLQKYIDLHTTKYKDRLPHPCFPLTIPHFATRVSAFQSLFVLVFQPAKLLKLSSGDFRKTDPNEALWVFACFNQTQLLTCRTFISMSWICPNSKLSCETSTHSAWPES